MQIKRVAALLCILCSFMLAGCAAEEGREDDGMRPVYYLCTCENGRELGYEVTEFDETKELNGQILDVIAAMRSPMNENNMALISPDMRVNDVQVFGSTVVVRFSDSYDRLPPIEKSLVSSAVTLSLKEIEQIRYVRVAGVNAEPAVFQSEQTILLDDEDLRLSSFTIEVFPVNRTKNSLFTYQMRIVTEKEEITPNIVLQEMVNGQLGTAAPFDGRMDVRIVSSISEAGSVRADLYVPVEMDLKGRELDIYSIVNTLCGCRGVESASITINGRPPSDRGLVNCDGQLRADSSYMGEENVVK